MGLFKKKTEEEKKATADKKAAALKQKAEEKAVAEGMKAELENKNVGDEFPEPPMYTGPEEPEPEEEKAIPLQKGVFSINEDVEKSIDSAKTVYTASSKMVEDFGAKIAACENENTMIATQQARIEEKTKELEGVFHQLDMMQQINSSYITLYKSQKKKIADIPGIVKKR
jgi:hypothetical protein